MLNLLRRVQFPSNVQISGKVIKAATIKFAKDHTDILAFAKQEAAQIVENAHREADLIKEAAREHTASAVRGDLSAIKSLTRAQQRALLAKATALCTEICAVVLEQFIVDCKDTVKIETLVKALLLRSHSSQKLTIHSPTEQSELVKASLAKVLAEQMNVRKWEVLDSSELKEFELRISTTNGSEINVSIDNLLAMYKEEIIGLEQSIKPALENLEVNNEEFN